MAALAGVLATTTACDDDKFIAGNPQVDVVAQNADAFYGDSLPFTIKASDVEVPLSTLKAQLYYGEEKVSETVIRTKTSGADYTGKIYVPFLKGTPDGKATLKYVLQNTSLTITEKEQELTLARPDYQYLTLVTADGTQYRMERKARNEYAANAAFPAKVNAYIVAPKYGDNGNELTFGWDGSGVALGASQEIPFSSTTSGKYDISFSTFSFEASPFAHIYFCGKEMSTTATPDVYTVDLTLNNGDAITVEGIANIDEWWLDPAYLKRGDDGVIRFVPMSGRYRVTANGKLNYFVIEVLDNDGNVPAQEQEALIPTSEPLHPAPKIFKETCQICWDKPAKTVYDFIRGLSPYPGAWTTLHKDQKATELKIYKAAKTGKPVGDAKPGSIETTKKALYMACADEWLEILSLQLAGKKRMEASAFINGNKGLADCTVGE